MRPLALLPLLLAACAHQTPSALPEFEPATESAPLDEGGGGFLPLVPYYIAHETMAQAEPPVGSPSWVGQAFNMTLSAPQGLTDTQCLVQGGSDGTGICLGGYPGASQNALYVGMRPSLRTSSNFVIRGNGGFVVLNSPSPTGAVYLRLGDALGWAWDGVKLAPENNGVFDLGGSVNNIRDGWFSGSMNTGPLNVSGVSTFAAGIAQADNNGAQGVRIEDNVGLSITGVPTTSLIACNATAPGGPNGTRGSVQYDTTNNRLKICNGTEWQHFARGGTTYAMFDDAATAGVVALKFAQAGQENNGLSFTSGNATVHAATGAAVSIRHGGAAGVEAARASEFGLKIADQGTRPVCAVGLRGYIWNEEGAAGVADVLAICRKDAADAYAWQPL